jgi:hypothetical protein
LRKRLSQPSLLAVFAGLLKNGWEILLGAIKLEGLGFGTVTLWVVLQDLQKRIL